MRLKKYWCFMYNNLYEPKSDYTREVIQYGNQSESTECKQSDLETKMYRIHLLCVKVNPNCVKWQSDENLKELSSLSSRCWFQRFTFTWLESRVAVLIAAGWVCSNPDTNRHFIFSLKFINIYNPLEIQLWRGLSTRSLQAKEKWCICHR